MEQVDLIPDFLINFMIDIFQFELQSYFSKHILLNNYFYVLHIYFIRLRDLLPGIIYENM